MVNGFFLLVPNWENFAGQTWSTRPYCRPLGTGVFAYLFEIKSFSKLARPSHYSIRTGRLGEQMV